MRYILLILLFLSTPVYSSAGLNQKNIVCKADYFKVDNLGYIYLINGTKLTKLNQDGGLNCEFTDNLLGDISSVDVTDPLRILLFYRESNKILFLDNKLSEIVSPITLDDLDIYSCGAACVSPQNRFWIFDDQRQKLIQFNSKRERIQESTSLEKIINNISQDMELFENSGFIYMNLKGSGVLIFDSFGTYFKTYPIKEVSSFTYFNGIYYYVSSDKIMTYNTLEMKENIYNFTTAPVKSICISGNKIYILSDGKLYIESLKK